MPLVVPAAGPAVSAGPVPSPQLLTEPAIPKTLIPSADQVLMLAYRAEGVQIYECRPSKTDPNVFEWVFLGPEATLFDDQGNKVGTHGAGPSWVANDGSKIVAAKIASADAPDGRAISWLLLRVESSAGTGPLSKANFIQRVDTWAGLAPKTGATKDNAGKQLRVRYQATYRFFGPAIAPGINEMPPDFSPELREAVERMADLVAAGKDEEFKKQAAILTKDHLHDSEFLFNLKDDVGRK